MKIEWIGNIYGFVGYSFDGAIFSKEGMCPTVVSRVGGVQMIIEIDEE